MKLKILAIVALAVVGIGAIVLGTLRDHGAFITSPP